ncbi:hypothetical protein CCR75_006304 [Bremia lactucae]|uniref:Uncharacterized protein n=1 Tax=Bremia lactucae TaxID=4779 RepID=A0A976FPD8_BRELC|nr:hypothetical protein CCR75_006304 [Bremia lactucae]
MTSIFSAGQSISSIGKSMTAIARIEEHLATFMKKASVTDTATLLFQRCYEYRDEIRDELESSVAYVADAGRWVVGMGDWNSKMEKRLNQISELVLLANSLLAEYAVMGKVVAEGCGDALSAYLQILSATVTLKNAPVRRDVTSTSKDQQLMVHKPSTTATDISFELTALGSEIGGAFSKIFGTNDLTQSVVVKETDNDAMNPFADSYRPLADPFAANIITHSRVQKLPDGIREISGAMPELPLLNKHLSENIGSPLDIGDYECLEMDSIPKYAAFRSTAQLAARREYAPCRRSNNLRADTANDEDQSTNNGLSKDRELFPLAETVSRKQKSMDMTTVAKSSIKPMIDMNYSYDFECEVTNNPFISERTPTSVGVLSLSTLDASEHLQSSYGYTKLPSAPSEANGATSTPTDPASLANNKLVQDAPLAPLQIPYGIEERYSMEQNPRDCDAEFDLFGCNKSDTSAKS